MPAGNFSGPRRGSVGEFTDLVWPPVPYNFFEYLAFPGNQTREVHLVEKRNLNFEEPEGIMSKGILLQSCLGKTFPSPKLSLSPGQQSWAFSLANRVGT